ncbi:NUDIX domain-containing protein [Ancylobacter sp. SL191]|uniref:NUDIX domain-containing protein n=1 Tax=Ancylobacter sp. SL191 TaxID=2995166 RepID=UPI00226D5EEF|nr:NUDIX hydrolase [Ancylobacter sp. SL191]WAC29261.1 NUDIX hydrolase [Ancylobacter sp. SL191]
MLIERAKAGPLEDRAIEVVSEPPIRIGDGFRPYERHHVTTSGRGGAPLRQQRDIIRVGPVVATLAYDPDAALFVLIRQFRIAAHLATGRGEIVELAAGLLEPGEVPIEAAARECREEIGVAPRKLLPMFNFLPSPGVSDEYAHVFLALVDSSQAPAEAGEAGETEHTRPLLVPVEDALASLTHPDPAIENGFVLLALQWFALNRERVAGWVGKR